MKCQGCGTTILSHRFVVENVVYCSPRCHRLRSNERWLLDKFWRPDVVGSQSRGD